MTFQRYLQFRLGAPGWGRWYKYFVKPFGARSFAEFWRLWNPVYGYFLYHYSYRPLSRVMPRPAAKMATFLLCGFVLHDLPAWAVARRPLPPGATIAFAFFGLGAIGSEAARMDLSHRPFRARAAVNAAYLAGSVAAMLVIVRKIV
jgi:MBOAT membrane-bound O-acyltransferase family protein